MGYRTSLEVIALYIMRKMDRKCRVGYIDWSALSYDWQVANARAWRIIARVHHGERLSMRQAMFS